MWLVPLKCSNNFPMLAAAHRKGMIQCTMGASKESRPTNMECRYRSILGPLDGSDFAEQVLPMALSLARLHSAAFHVVRVYTPVAGEAGEHAMRYDGTLDRELMGRARDYLDRVTTRLAEAAGFRLRAPWSKDRSPMRFLSMPESSQRTCWSSRLTGAGLWRDFGWAACPRSLSAMLASQFSSCVRRQILPRGWICRRFSAY